MLVTSEDCVKLGDFGLSRGVEEHDYYKGKQPRVCVCARCALITPKLKKKTRCCVHDVCTSRRRLHALWCRMLLLLVQKIMTDAICVCVL